VRAGAAKPAAERKGRLRRERGELYRRLVIEAAERLFAENGADDTHMDEIAREAGLSLGTLYSVFEGKADIVAAIHEARLAALLAASMQEAGGEQGTVDRLVAGLRGYVRFFLDHPNYLRMHLREGYTWAGERAAPTRSQADAWGKGIEVLARLFERGAREGVIHVGDPAVQARILIATQQVQLAAWVEGGMQGDAATVLSEVETYLRRTFCP
jgi:AcrR family transcriptional regulator